jgi:hypothetical protein
MRHEVHDRKFLNAQGEEKIDRPKGRRLLWLEIALIYTVLVCCLNQYSPPFLEPYILFLHWLLVLFDVVLALRLAVCSLVCLGIFLGQCIKYIWLAVWAGSIKYFNYLATRAVLVYGLGKQKVKHSMVRTRQLIILLGKIAIAPTFYAVLLASPSASKYHLVVKHVLMTRTGAQNIHQDTSKWDIWCQVASRPCSHPSCLQCSGTLPRNMALRCIRLPIQPRKSYPHNYLLFYYLGAGRLRTVQEP